MSTLKISLAGLNFLHRVLSETGVTSRTDVNKQRSAFQSIAKPLEEGKKALEVVRKTYRKNVPHKDANGNETDRWMIPEESKEVFESKVLEIENTMVEINMNPETVTVFKLAIDALFARQAKEVESGASTGITGETTMKLIGEASDALDNA